MELNKSLYIEPRQGKDHILLDGIWSYAYFPKKTDDIENIEYLSEASIPQTAGWCLYESKRLPHPYYGLNSSKYEFISDRVWYFKRSFKVEKQQKQSFAYLCFDGTAYYTRIWLNGILLGEHEGMFGGPVIEVSDKLKYGENNEIVVETVPCNYGSRDDISDDDNMGLKNWAVGKRAIVPWNLTNDTQTSNGHFNVVGIWRSVRIEFLSKYHISNPYLYTQSIDGNSAKLKLEVPLCTPFTGEEKGLSSKLSVLDNMPMYTYSAGTVKKYTDDVLTVEIEITESESGKTIYSCSEKRRPFSLKSMYGESTANDYLYYVKKIELNNIKLWYPNGHGSQPLYCVKIKLLLNGNECDISSFLTGIRTVKVEEGVNEKLYRRWEKFQFVVNGEKIFLKGMNFTPSDQMLKESKEEIEWILKLAKNDGIGMIRVWNGGGTPESDYFYELCDKYGFMVWQDTFIANAVTPAWDPDVLRSQLFYNLIRLRNHPSLAVICGGNEFNPYTSGNAASMYAIWDETNTHVPDRIFYRTTPNGGSAHIYNDMEPTWYRHLYKNLAFVGESGIHNFPSYKTLKQIISEKEAESKLDNIFSAEFEREFPELRNHFNEFQPERVPRMLARASHIADIKSICLNELTEAVQISAYEYYLIMIESMLENYPVTTGIMPWVFKRPWPTAAIQIVDGFGNPEAQYYAVKRAYQNCHPFVALETLAFRPGETVHIPVKIFCDYEINADVVLKTEIFDGKLKRLFLREESFVKCPKYCFNAADYYFDLPGNIIDSYFFIRVRLFKGDKELGESFYYPKVLACLAKEEIFNRERSEPCGNMLFENGPYLKRQIEKCRSGNLACRVLGKMKTGRSTEIRIVVENIGDALVFPVNIDSVSEKVRCMCDDNFFVLDSFEKKEVTVLLDGENGYDESLSLSAWNANEITVL